MQCDLSDVSAMADLLVDAAGHSEGLGEVVQASGGATSGASLSSVCGGKPHMS